MINLFIAILVNKLIITEEEGKKLAKEFGFSTLPSDFNEMLRIVNKIVKKVDKDI